jgi:hypothetical protein
MTGALIHPSARLSVADWPDTLIRITTEPKPTDTAREEPVSAPWAEILPDAEDAARALPDSTITDTTAPLAALAVAEIPEMTRGTLAGMVTAPKP